MICSSVAGFSVAMFIIDRQQKIGRNEYCDFSTFFCVLEILHFSNLLLEGEGLELDAVTREEFGLELDPTTIELE